MKKTCGIAMAFVLLLWLAGGVCAAESDETGKASEGDDAVSSPINEVWNSLLRNREEELASVRSSLNDLSQKLPDEKARLSAEIAKVSKAFSRTLTVIQISRDRPLELSLAEDGLLMLRRRLENAREFFDNALSSAASQQEVLSRLSVKEDEAADAQMKAFLADTKKEFNKLKKIRASLDAELLPVSDLDKRIASQQDSLKQKMPALWKSYYLPPAGRFFSSDSWVNFTELPKLMHESLRVRLLAGMPSDRNAWASVLGRFFTVLLPLYFMLIMGQRAAKTLPEPFASGTSRILRVSLPWIGWGLACHFAAWSDGIHYGFLSMLGTVFLCFGQLFLAWALYRFEAADARGRSVLLRIMVPQVAGLLLFLLNLPELPLGIVWIAVIGGCLYQNHAKDDVGAPGLVRWLLGGHAVMLWLAFALTLLGWGRLSILLCMAYAALTVCVMQAVGVLHLSGLIYRCLPPRGITALVGGFALALLMPLLLGLLTCASALWGMAYPGFPTLLEHISTHNISVGMTSFNLIQILYILGVFYFCRSLVRVGRGLISEYAYGSRTFDRGLAGPLQAGYTYTLWLLFALYVLHVLGVSLASLSMVAGGLSVGIGLGLQSVIKDFISGLQLLFGKTLREGDLIEVSGQTVTVKQISIRHTMVETFDNAMIFIPNGELLAGRLTNWTRNGKRVRKTVSVGVAYGSDVSRVIALLLEIADEHPHVLSTPKPYVILSDFGDSTLDFILYVNVDNINNALGVTHDLRVTIERRFREENIEMAFPQMDIHLKRDAAPGVTA